MPVVLESVREGVFVDRGGGNAVVFRDRNRALVFNPGNPGLPGRLRAVGIDTVDEVCFTHHRRELADGLEDLLRRADPEIVVPAAERKLFADPAAYWAARESRWALLCGHVPYHVTHVRPVAVSRAVSQRDEFTFGEWRFEVLDTPGYTDGSVSYLASRGNQRLALTGDLIYAPGMVRDLYCHQHTDTKNGHRVGDYHGFMGSMDTVVESLEAVLAEEPDALIPAHGQVMDDPAGAVELLRTRYESAYRNYVGISALRWYFPVYFQHHAIDEGTLPLQATFPFPPNVRRLCGTTWALRAGDGHAILIDPYCRDAVEAAGRALSEGEIAGYDAIWLTHYHHDHVGAAEEARTRFDAPILTDRIMADVITSPHRHFLTCLIDAPAEVARPTGDGETWRWRDYTLTAYHFPGQTHYHSGLFAVPEDGPTLFFAGDAVTPTGIDDYCTWNRNWLGKEVGFGRCLRLLRSLDPDLIFNQHVEVAFRFSDAAYRLMLSALEQREKEYGDLVPWSHPDFATDESWVHTDPYEQRAKAGSTVRIAVRVRNHGGELCHARAGLQVPDGWKVTPAIRFACEAKREGSSWFDVCIPPDATGRHVLPVMLRFGETELGSWREAIVRVEGSSPGAGGSSPEGSPEETGHGKRG